MITETFATQFAYEWISAWNAHDVDAIMDHYADEIEFCSPVVIQITNDPSGTIRDKATLRSYFTKGLGKYPDLHFDLHKILISVNSVVLYYTSINNMMAAECMVLNEQGKVTEILAHYAQ